MTASPVSVRPTGNQSLDELLALHPNLRVEGSPSPPGKLCFRRDDWRRELVLGDSSGDLRGLIELIDNNPLACADSVCVPSPLETLGSIALAPLAKADLLVEAPALLASFPEEGHRLDCLLSDFGWGGGATVKSVHADLGSVLSVAAYAHISASLELSTLADLFEECYGRSFFVRAAPDADWDPSLVAGKPFALYRLGIALHNSHSVLNVQVVADRDGKCGAAQVVHTLNVMSGFEESLPFTV